MNSSPFALDSLAVASPCPENWDAMPGDDRRRYCSRCRLHVYNLSAMTSAEVADLVEGREGRLCVRYIRRHDGKVMTADCPHASVARRRRVLAFATILTLGLSVVAIGHANRRSQLATNLRRNRFLRPIIDWFSPPEIVGEVCPSPGPSQVPQRPPGPSSSNPQGTGTRAATSR